MTFPNQVTQVLIGASVDAESAHFEPAISCPSTRHAGRGEAFDAGEMTQILQSPMDLNLEVGEHPATLGAVANVDVSHEWMKRVRVV